VGGFNEKQKKKLKKTLDTAGVVRDTALVEHLAYTLARKSKGPNMQAALKALHSPDIANVESYQPEREDHFGFVLRAVVGPMAQPGEESFDITVTPKWLAEQYGTSEIVLGLHKVIVFRYDYSALRRFIEKYLMRRSGNTWAEIAQKVRLPGQ
jgi:hypothetical protein